MAEAQSQISAQLERARANAARLQQANALAGVQAGDIATLRSAASARDAELALARHALAGLEAARWTNRFKRQLERWRVTS